MTAGTNPTVFQTFADVCARASRGDLEARVPATSDDPAVVAARDELNRLLDVVDAYVRESTAALSSANEGRFHRVFLEGGMTGAFAEGAQKINEAREAMQAATDEVDAARAARQSLADEMETAVLSASEQVATAATEIGATASGLASFASNAADESGRATQTVSALDAASDEIKQAVRMVTQVAAQTRLLALNATIEAARAGDAGRGFSVVASEVKSLADEASKSASAINERVAMVQQASAEVISVLDNITGSIRQMDSMTAGIAAAIEGGVHEEGAGDMTGLSRLAEMLRSQVTRFVEEVRSA
ncbi:methyl-accepting chemotaxis protein [Actinophytocola sp.]|uniref:methyl-accepting chemotaxis protein n=1 Tax=Actinophytocola sp. TaxID=1872138 RepID=UPI002D81136C|nr:methyl-accepting chemotaxis protein [Actinophytocola sp.]HET9138821.1 methyl-accepting chemotaxis protein [Actinophytocola sp.]